MALARWGLYLWRSETLAMHLNDLHFVTLHLRAITKLMGLSGPEKRAVEKTLLALDREEDRQKLSLKKLQSPSYPEIYSVRAGNVLRLLFVLEGDAVTVLDIVDRKEWPIAA